MFTHSVNCVGSDGIVNNTEFDTLASAREFFDDMIVAGKRELTLLSLENDYTVLRVWRNSDY